MKKINYLMLILFIFVSVGCAEKQPECNDSDVKEVLFGLIREQMQKEYEKLYFDENWNYSDLRSYARDNGINVQNYIDEKRLELKKEAKIKVEQIVAESTIELSGVRLTDKDEEIKKCECISEMIIDRENSREIKYTAQYTEDDQIYVEWKY